MTAPCLPEPGVARDDDLKLRISSPGGMPLSVAGWLLQAIGSGYPGTMIETGTGAGAGTLSLRIPAEDYLDRRPDQLNVAEIPPVKDDPDMIAFLDGLDGGGLRFGPPAWLTAMLEQALRMILEAVDPPNYVQMQLNAPDGDRFSWIVCRPGRPSPHDLREAAEQRVAALEAQLRAAGIEPESTVPAAAPE